MEGGGGGNKHPKVMHLNMRSLITGFDEMSSLVCDFDLDVFAIGFITTPPLTI